MHHRPSIHPPFSLLTTFQDWEPLPTARSSVSVRENGFAQVALAPAEIEIILMQQEDKLAYNVRLEQINNENKAVFHIYFLHYISSV